MQRGLKNVFLFTLRQKVCGKGYRGGVLAGMLLCFLVPVLIFGLVEGLRPESESGQAPEAGFEPAGFERMQTLYLLDRADGALLEPAVLKRLLPYPGAERCVSLPAEMSLDEARGLIAESERDVLLLLQGGISDMEPVLYTPDGMADEAEDTAMFTLARCMPMLVAAKRGISPETLAAMGVTTSAAITVCCVDPESGAVVDFPQELPDDSATTEDEGEPGMSAAEGARELLAMVIPYLVTMLLYFMVLFYGQAAANSIIMEKNSKLMDYFLVYVRPADMMLGKVLAIALSGILEIALWLLSLAGGLACGLLLASRINPDSAITGVVRFVRELLALPGLFSAGGLAVAVCVMLAGFLLYCCLSAVGGSMAGKPEDLSVTNSLFSAVLIISFLATLYLGVMDGEQLTGAAALLYYIPFTAIFIMPGHVALGIVPVGTGCACLCVMLVFSLGLLYLAGQVYRACALLKGNPPKPWELLRVLRGC